MKGVRVVQRPVEFAMQSGTGVESPSAAEAAVTAPSRNFALIDMAQATDPLSL
jgi:hypothetical protein